jgi:NADH-quinone oxidoreductase subunit H
MFFFAEYSNLFLVSGVTVALFLGGTAGPFGLLDGPHWFILKAYLLIFCVMWFRWTFPRLRFDQLMSLAWKLLIPLALINLLVTGLVIKAL